MESLRADLVVTMDILKTSGVLVIATQLAPRTLIGRKNNMNVASQTAVRFRHEQWYNSDGTSSQYENGRDGEYIKYSLEEQINKYLADHPTYTVAHVSVLRFDHSGRNVNHYYHDYEDVMVIFSTNILTPTEKVE